MENQDYSLCSDEYIVGMAKGLNRAKEIIENEMIFAKIVNPQMAMGMSQVLMLINKEIKNS